MDPTPVSWDSILDLFGLGDLTTVAVTGVGLLVGVTIAMTGYRLFRRLTKGGASA